MGDATEPVDRALLDLDESWNEEVNPPPVAQDNGGNDRTIAGLGVGTPPPLLAAAAPSPDPEPRPAPHLQPGHLTLPEPKPEPQPELVHAEQSPLAFVMRASELANGPQKEHSHDMSMFVAGLVADTSPVVETAPAGTAMEPVQRRSRKRRQWTIASVIAATAIVGAAVGVHFGAKHDAPRIAANEMPADVAPKSPSPAIEHAPTQPTAPATPTVDEVAPAPAADVAPPHVEVANAVASTTSAPTATPVVAISPTTAKTPSVAKTETKTTTKKVAPKKVATANTTAKNSAKKPSPTKSAIAKKSTAKKPTPAKKPMTSPKKPTPKKTRR